VIFSAETLDLAYEASSLNEDTIQASTTCGCFSCLQVFPSTSVTEWDDEGLGGARTALCPNCGTDSVIDEVSEFPIQNPQFLAAMQRRWIDNESNHA
jgi:hypothetical protein